MAKILCIGSVTKDIFFPTKEGVILDTPEDFAAQRKIAFELGAKYHIKNRFETLGGCSMNVAVGLSKLGENVACLVAIGDDDCGRWIEDKMKIEGVDANHLIKIENETSDLSVIIIDANSGDRTIFSNHGASQKLQISGRECIGFDWVFIGDLSGQWKDNFASIADNARKSGAKIAFNPRQQMLHEDIVSVANMLKYCDILFLNKDEAIEIVKGNSNRLMEEEEDLSKMLFEMGAKIVVITDGTRGAWSFDGQLFTHAQAIVRQAVDTTGAGDAFASGFFAAILKGNTHKEALAWGIANSSSSVTSYGGQAGLLTEKEIAEY